MYFLTYSFYDSSSSCGLPEELDVSFPWTEECTSGQLLSILAGWWLSVGPGYRIMGSLATGWTGDRPPLLDGHLCWMSVTFEGGSLALVVLLGQYGRIMIHYEQMGREMSVSALSMWQNNWYLLLSPAASLTGFELRLHTCDH